MKKNALRGMIMVLAIALLVPFMAGCAQSKELVIFTYDGYVSDGVLKEFEQEFGVTVNFQNFSSNEEMLSKLQSVKGGEYDIIIASDYVIDIARQENLIAKLDKSKIPNFSNIDPQFQNVFFDPTNEYSVPYVAGTPLIVYDPSRVPFEIKGYKDLWNEELADSVVLMNDMRNVMGINFKASGGSLNTTDSATIEASKDQLFALAPNVRALDGDTPQALMISGEAAVGYMFTPHVTATLEKRPEFVAVYPEEGMGYGIDSLFIPVNAPNMDTAHKFLDFLLRGEISARCSEEQQYINCNLAAKEFLSEEFLSNPALYIPQEAVTGEMEFMMDIGSEATAQYDRVWTEFLSLLK